MFSRMGLCGRGIFPSLCAVHPGSDGDARGVELDPLGLQPPDPDWYTRPMHIVRALLSITAIVLMASPASSWVASGGDTSKEVAVDSSGNAVGTTRGAMDNVVKFAGPDGAIVWAKSIANSIHAEDVALDSVDEVFVSFALADGSDGVVKLRRSNGDERWRHVWNGNIAIRAIAVDGNDDVLVALKLGTSFQISKLSGATGVPLWSSATFPGEARTLEINASGDVFAAGHAVTSPDPSPATATKLNGATGAEIWRTDVGEYETFSSVALVPGGDPVFATDKQRVTRMDATTGAIVWDRSETPFTFPTVRGIAVGASGNPIVAGTMPSPLRLVVIQLDQADGSDEWTTEHLYPAGGALGIDSAGDVVVGGLLKLDEATGGVVWSSDRGASSIGFDANDDIFLATGGEFAKLDGSTGELAIPDVALDVSLGSHDFRRVDLGQVTPIFFELSSLGQTDALISAISVTGGGGEFAVVSPAAPLTLPTGEIVEFELAYTPAIAGPVSATLEIASNDGLNPLIAIPLAGIGVQPQCGDGADNDGDGDTDFPDDTQCASARSLLEEPDVLAVDDASDAGDASPGDGNCATVAATCTLRAAVQEANATPGPARIDLPEGTYALTLPGGDEDLAASGDLDLLDDVDIVGSGDRTLTVVDAGNADRLFQIHGDSRVRIQGMTLINGQQDDSFALPEGGAIYNEGDLTVSDVVVRDNLAENAGGVMSLGPLLVEDSLFEENRADASTSTSAIRSLERARIARTTTTKPTAGGGRYQIWLDGLGNSRIEDSVIIDAPNNSGVRSDQPAEVVRSTIQGNGGTGIRASSRLTVRDSTIASNGATQTFGAGGIDSDSGRLHVVNSTIFNNYGAVDVGGIAASFGLIEHTTIVRNAMAEGYSGGVGSSSVPPALVVRNSIVADNTAVWPWGDVDPSDCGRGIVSGGYNVIGAPSVNCTAFDDPTDQVGSAASPLDPVLSTLLDNGGPTQTLAVLAGSPALDLIPAANCTHDHDGDPSTPDIPLDADQRGIARTAPCEVGAFEVETAAECDDGVDNDGDGLTDWDGGGGSPDPGCDDPADASERSDAIECDNGLDDDGDGRLDFDPETFADPTQGSGDPGCASAASDDESPACQDGVNNDADVVVDFDGGQSVHGACTGLPGGCPAGVSDPDADGIANIDPVCQGRPWFRRESSPQSGCGIGAEWSVVLLGLAAARRRWKR